MIKITEERSPKRDLIFIFFGGGMKGVFGAGVANTLKELDLYDRIHSIYAVSAGAHDAAYFLAKEAKLGVSIYYEDLVKTDKFIKKNKSKFYSSLIMSLIRKGEKIEKLMDIDYLMDVEKNKKRLNIEMISKSQIPFFIRLFNCQNKKVEWVDGKTDIFKKLQATAAVVPFYPSKVEINGIKYFDGDTLSEIIDPVLEKVINDNPDKKIFIVLNTSKENRFSMFSLVEDILWTILLLIFIRKEYVLNKLHFLKEKRRLDKYCKFPNVKIIDPDFDVSEFCIDKEEELKLYRNGIEKTKKILAECL